jgi:hypothetical protein
MTWNPFDLVDMLIFVLGLTMLAYTIGLTIKTPDKWLVIFPITFWAAHLTFFYGVILVGDITNAHLIDDAHIIWSTIQRLHGVITMFYVTWLLSNSTMNWLLPKSVISNGKK